MAIINVVTTQGAVAPARRDVLAVELARLTYEAEGFAGSKLAPRLCWTFFEEKPGNSFSTGAGAPPAPLYYVRITALAGALNKATKQKLGMEITLALLAGEEGHMAEDLSRVWVCFNDVLDGDLIVGGDSTSLLGLRELVAQAS